ncbi:tail fiber domain-containing protein [Pelagerythrobacter marinus]|uniref:tail fiber domain-containing protein n=1 Tax=Pelagerythrobacter marinus TaxID=538382 RepID=UPI002AC9AB4C|nr:tail fiber domain-containing protein [Pelagerythrobacter marinus]WPZ05487.1 tail fiber domain-containing protein [Pelagerythrobacter marinus]
MLGLHEDLLARFRDGDPTIDAAKGYLTDTLTGDPTQNPYLDDMIAQTNDSVRNQLQAKMGTRGLTGGSDYYGLIGRELAKNETGLRYTDYDKAMDRKTQAAGLAPGVTAAEYIPVAGAMEAGQAGAMLPLQGALANSAGVGGLLGQYQNVKGTQKQSGSFMDMLGMGLQAASMFSDRRLKTDVRRVGRTDAGTPIYTYRYGGEGPFHMGVMADEVNENALGPVVDGFATVRYEEVA